MNDLNKKQPFDISSNQIVIFGSIIVALLVGAIFVFVPPAPLNNGVQQPLHAVVAAPAARVKLESGVQGYKTYCASCHGIDGLAQTPIARMSGVKIPSLVAGTYKLPGTLEATTQLVLNGQGGMPGFKDEVGEEGAKLIATYILTLRKN